MKRKNHLRKFLIVILIINLNLICFSSLYSDDNMTKVDNLIQQGENFLKQGKFNEAINVFCQAVLIDPNFPRTFVLLGNAFEGTKDFKNALRSYEEALLINSDNPSALFQYAVLQDKLGLFEEAVISFNKSIRLKPEYPTPYYYRALTYISIKNLDGAMESLKKYISLIEDPSNEDLRDVEKDNYKKAKSIFAQISKLFKVDDKKSSSSKKKK